LWGRARPGDILELDGKEDFTPWFQISDACANNCSFVSGDASVGFAVIVLYFLSKKMVFFWLSLFCGFGIGLIRIMEGGHFVSDIVIAALVLYLVYYFQIKYYFNKYD
jgi:lipid A 4'-phosphatase